MGKIWYDCPDMEDVCTENTALRAACFTGHRELPRAGSAAFTHLKRRVRAAIALAADRGVTRFYSGGAEGFDLLCGQLVLEAQRMRPQLQLMLVLPYTGHGEQFSKGDQRELARQKEAAEEVVYLSTHYFPGCMALRNRQLVADADLCIAYLTHAPSGTAQTVGFARGKGIEVLYV